MEPFLMTEIMRIKCLLAPQTKTESNEMALFYPVTRVVMTAWINIRARHRFLNL